jgi:hypothetical protein
MIYRAQGETPMRIVPRRPRLNDAGLRPVLGFLALLGALTVTPGDATAAAITSTWTDGNGNWSLPANWDNGVPNNGGGDTFTAVINNGSTVTLDITAGITSLFIDFFAPPTSTLILGSGQTLVVSGDVVNANVIAANTPGGSGLQVSGVIFNGGSLRASGGGSLVLLGAANVSNSFGKIEALSGSIVSLQNGGVVGGTLTTSGTGAIEAPNGTSLQDLTNAAYFRLNGGTTLLAGTVTNTGTFAADQPGGGALQWSGAAVLANQGTLLASGGGRLTLLGGTLNNTAGTIQALDASVVDLQSAQIAGGTLTTAGTGVIEANDVGLQDLTNAGFYRLKNTNVLAGTVTNTGTFAVDQPGFGALQWGGSATLANKGTLLASGGGQLNLLGGTLDNTGGTIQAFDGSIVDFFSGTIKGGTLTTAGTGVIEASVVGLQDLTNAGFFRLTSTSLVSGTVTNTGSFVADQPGFGALQLIPGATLANNGTLRASGGSTLFLIGTGTVTNTGTFQVDAGSRLGCFLPASECPTLSNFDAATGTLSGGTYRVTGTFNFVGANIVTNAATIVLDTPGSAVTDESNLDAFRNFAANTGSFTLQGGRSLTAPGNFTNSGAMQIASGSSFAAGGATYMQTAGTTNVNGELSAGSLVDIRGGALSGDGVIGGDLNNAGIVSPGNSPGTGTLLVSGNYTQTAGGVLEIEIGGLIAGDQYDVLRIFGNASLDGTLDVALIDGFDPTAGDFFDILVTGFFGPGSVTGTFAAVELPPTSTGTWAVEYLADRVRLEFEVPGSEVPEPPAILVMLAGPGALAILRRSRRRPA